VCLDKRGKPQFRDLLFHRREPCFFAFDLLMSDGKDLRTEKLTDRKQELRRLLSKGPASRMRYADHGYGTVSAYLRNGSGGHRSQAQPRAVHDGAHDVVQD
jgi:ATP-dependent DNA ligase